MAQGVLLMLASCFPVDAARASSTAAAGDGMAQTPAHETEVVQNRALSTKAAQPSRTDIEPVRSHLLPGTKQARPLERIAPVPTGKAGRAMERTGSSERQPTSAAFRPSGASTTPETDRALKLGTASPEFRAQLGEIRKTAKPLLNQALFLNAAARPAAPVADRTLRHPKAPKADPAPLPGAVPPGIKADAPDCEPCRRIEELEKRLATEKDPGIAGRLQLDLAGLHVGQGNWQAAKAIYDRLAATTPDGLVRLAAQRNLEVVERNLRIKAEPDRARREALELELADLHRDLGHEQAAKELWRRLEKSAQQPSVREQAGRLQGTSLPPSRLPAVPRRNPEGK